MEKLVHFRSSERCRYVWNKALLLTNSIIQLGNAEGIFLENHLPRSHDIWIGDDDSYILELISLRYIQKKKEKDISNCLPHFISTKTALVPLSDSAEKEKFKKP